MVIVNTFLLYLQIFFASQVTVSFVPVIPALHPLELCHSLWQNLHFICLFDLETLYGFFGSFASFFLFMGGLPEGLYTVEATEAGWLVSIHSS